MAVYVAQTSGEAIIGIILLGLHNKHEGGVCPRPWHGVVTECSCAGTSEGVGAQWEPAGVRNLGGALSLGPTWTVPSPLVPALAPCLSFPASSQDCARPPVLTGACQCLLGADPETPSGSRTGA